MYRQGEVYVVQDAAPSDKIQRELQRLEPRLRLQVQLGIDHYPVWCVIYDGDPPTTILEWRDEETGLPIPELHWAIVERVKKMESSDGKLVERAIRKNQELARIRQEAGEEEVAQIFREMIPKVMGKERILAPRGQKLYQQRNKRRARGEI